MMLKKILLQLLFLFIAAITYAQDTAINEIPKTQIEKFSLRAGSILKKEWIDVFSCTDKSFFSSGSLKVQAETITDAASGESIRGLVFTATDAGVSYYSLNRHAGFIDENE